MQKIFSFLIVGLYFTVLQASTVQAADASDCAQDNSIPGCVWVNGQWEMNGGEQNQQNQNNANQQHSQGKPNQHMNQENPCVTGLIEKGSTPFEAENACKQGAMAE